MMVLMSCRRLSASTIQNVFNLLDGKTDDEHINPQIVDRMSNTRSCSSLDDLPIEILSRIIVLCGSESAKDIISTIICSKKMYTVGCDPQLFRTTSTYMIEGVSPKHLNDDLFIHRCAVHNNIEAIFRQGVLLDAYFGWAVLDHGEYIGVVDNSIDFLKTFDVVHILTTNNITFQCEEELHSVKGAFVVGHEEDEDPQSYCMVCRWYVEYGMFCSFLKYVHG
uniref:F-box domain-containing protein n=1 Tax=Lactuca sativa TaxID=4236 RepID=A0A9R1XKZ5_LACSA|nr:hypothetical protein LSAT_V11C300138970 [Lactuca sativa]